jgi:hypothetical protein
MGEDNCSDLLTKNLVAAKIEKHLIMMGIHGRKGRSDKAAKLHLLDKSSAMEFLEARNKLKAGRDGGDRWLRRGDGNIWQRAHTTPRMSLFTPYKVANGPASQHEFCPTRFTQGITRSGQRFEFHDSWQRPERRHFTLGEEWIGVTSFIDATQSLSSCIRYVRHPDL